MVTDEMIVAAHRQLPGISNRVRVRRAVEAALALLPDPQRPVELPVTARIVLRIDEQQLLADAAEAISHRQADLAARLPFFLEGDDADRRDAEAELVRLGKALPVEPHVAVDGLEGPGVTDATGQRPVTISEPVLNPALARPLELGSLADIARRRGVARSTVTGWVKNRASNGMPEPVDGDVYDLAAVDAWHQAWKAGD